jgi:hypothetical protein
MPNTSPNTLFNRLQAIFNTLAGISNTRFLPNGHFEPAPWELNREKLQIPAAWRRRSATR